MVEGGATIVKHILFLANFALWASGLGLIVGGAVLQLRWTGLLDVLGDERLATPLLLLAMGTAAALLGFLGCCGAIRENYCLVVAFGVLLGLLLLLETAIVIAVYALSDQLRASLSAQLTAGLARYNKSEGVALAWDETQRALACCGVWNATDWSPARPPDSCCRQERDGCAQNAWTASVLASGNVSEPDDASELANAWTGALWSRGCVPAAERWLFAHAATLGSLSALLAALQIVGICFACCLSKSILKDFNDFYY